MNKLSLPNLNLEEQGLSFTSVFKSVFISYGLSIVLLALFAIILTYTNFPESSISTVVLAVSLISILYAGKIAAKRAKNRGWLIGSVAGLTYIAILYLISLILTKRPVFDLHVLFIFAMGFFVGAVGGIVGINFRKPEKRYK